MDKSYKSYGHYADLGIELIDQEYNHKIQKKLEYTSQFLIYHQIDQNEYLQYLSTSRKFFVFYFYFSLSLNCFTTFSIKTSDIFL
jgi:hypothetical protein